MKIKIWIPIIAILLFAAVDSYGQRWKLQRYDLDVGISGVAFHGDIGLANRPFENMFNGFRPSVSLTPRFRITEKIAVGMELGYIMYGGTDEPGSSHGRYYSFNSHAFVHGFRGEYLIVGGGRRVMSGGVYNRRGMVNNYSNLNVYAFGGINGILSKSHVKDLDAGGEEPLDNPGYYNNAVYSVVFPLGAGLRWSFDPRWSMGFELGYSFSLSDKLDGYMPAASNYNDSYYLISVKAIYKIRNNRRNVPQFKRLYR